MAKNAGKSNRGNDFKALPVKFDENSLAVQYLFYKIHRVREKDDEKPTDRTLFVINIPPYCTEECFRRLFADCGDVEKVIFKQDSISESSKDCLNSFVYKPARGYKVGYIVFSEKQHCEAVLNITDSTPRLLSTEEHPLMVGINKWTQEYNDSIPDVEAIKDKINKCMEEYDIKVKKTVEKEKEMTGVPDEEGWITVTRGNKKSVARRTKAKEKRTMMKEKKTRAKKELVNFYSFQIRESKMDHIVQLRKKFEEDKQRIALLKAARKFKPY